MDKEYFNWLVSIILTSIVGTCFLNSCSTQPAQPAQPKVTEVLNNEVTYVDASIFRFSDFEKDALVSFNKEADRQGLPQLTLDDIRYLNERDINRLTLMVKYHLNKDINDTVIYTNGKTSSDE